MYDVDIHMLSELLHQTRQIGKTRAAVKLARDSEATLICLNRVQAEQIKKVDRIKTCPIEGVANHFRGKYPSGQQVVVDQDAALAVIDTLMREGEYLKAERSKLKKQLAYVFRELLDNSSYDELCAIGLTTTDPEIRELFEKYI